MVVRYRVRGMDSAGQARQSLKRQFDERFGESGVALPAAAAAHGLSGWLRREGWKASFIWGARFEFLEYEAEWGVAGDQFHWRLWLDGRVDELDSMNEFVEPAIEPDVAAAIDAAGDYNRGVRNALVARGLWPWDEIGSRGEAWEQQGLNPHELMRWATEQSARTIDPHVPKDSFLESKLEGAVMDAVGMRVDPELLGARRNEFKIPGWTEHLGAIDLYLRDAHGGLRLAWELKVDDVEFVLWDLLKLANTFELGSVDAAFLIVSAPLSTWGSGRDCVELFDSGPGTCLRWPTREMIGTWSKAWQHDLAEGTARPVRAPAELDIESIARAPVESYPGYELRTLAVRPVPNGGEVAFANGLPTA